MHTHGNLAVHCFLPPPPTSLFFPPLIPSAIPSKMSNALMRSNTYPTNWSSTTDNLESVPRSSHELTASRACMHHRATDLKEMYPHTLFTPNTRWKATAFHDILSTLLLCRAVSLFFFTSYPLSSHLLPPPTPLPSPLSSRLPGSPHPLTPFLPSPLSPPKMSMEGRYTPAIEESHTLLELPTCPRYILHTCSL